MVTYLLSSAPRRILAARRVMQLVLPINIQLSKITGFSVRSQNSAPAEDSADFDFWILMLLVGLGRLELPTSPLSGVRSSHLSYRPGTELVELVGIEPATS